MAALPQIQTERLLLRPWRPEDVEPFAKLCGDPEVMRYIGRGAVRDRQQCESSIGHFQLEWEERGFGLFAVERLDTQSFIGFTGLSVPTFLPEIMPSVEIGWRLSREHWGQGFATEAAQAAMRFGLEDQGIPEIVCVLQVENAASRNIAKKLGMILDRQTVDPTCDRPIEVYRISAS